jgi:ATP-dependent DNA helicase RecG
MEFYMAAETQNIEWKESWRDEYIKIVCAFANASGGVIEIGRDKYGRLVGLTKTEKLMEDLPNKIRGATGVIPAVDLHETNNMQYIAINVNPYSFPVSYNGKYYYRSGSTTQLLSGAALDEFILRKQGKTWDGVPVPYVKLADFEIDAFRIFRRKAIAGARLTAQDLEITDDVLIKNLQLVEGEYLKRAALLLFHQDLENWVPGAYLKIGFFENAADLIFQDEIHGPLINIADKAEDLVYTKYFKGIISYNGLQRIETFPVPRQAFREAVINAVIHRDYSTGNPIHIHIYPDKVLIYNDGCLPETWTVDDLFAPHTSKPYNPLLAGAFFRSGQIEAWGRGIEKIISACKYWNKPEPFFRLRKNEVMIGFYTGARAGKNMEDFIGDKIGDFIGNNIGDSAGYSIGENEFIYLGKNDKQYKILHLMIQNPKISARLIADEIGIAQRNVEVYIKTLKQAGLIERTGSAKGGYWVVKMNHVKLRQ